MNSQISSDIISPNNTVEIPTYSSSPPKYDTLSSYSAAESITTSSYLNLVESDLPKISQQISNSSSIFGDSLVHISKNALSRSSPNTNSLINENNLNNSYIKVNSPDSSVLGKGKISSVYQGYMYLNPPTNNSQKNENYFNVALKVINSGDEDAFEAGIIEACILNYIFNICKTDVTRSIAKFYGIAISVDAPFNTENQNSNDTQPQFYQLKTGTDIITDLYSKKYDNWAIVLELYDNKNTWDWLESHPESMGHELFNRWSSQLNYSLSGLHSIGIIHNDIKPQNILVSSNLNAYICDFSSSICSKDLCSYFKDLYGFQISDFLAYGDIAGTIVYSAPETLSSGFNPFNQTSGNIGTSDIFSLGVTLFCLFITGRNPYFDVKSNLELMILAKKGTFYSWELARPAKTLKRSATITNLLSTPPTQNKDDPIPLSNFSFTRNNTITSRHHAFKANEPFSNSLNSCTNPPCLETNSPTSKKSSRYHTNNTFSFDQTQASQLNQSPLPPKIKDLTNFLNGEPITDHAENSLKNSLTADISSRNNFF
ncbi:putative serine/threonine-protein kinase KCC4 [Smittium culicis]|uniref:Putative serine/threonine-protein kinase KCC4 n=1 Tax=Smittium culicis TaxID=133412 RepID=A0A1R1YEB7_9FUNG|nr:putative serine/threonine-protein kinase KCC4 [Smittium culicis]